jgi:hypothetical protein
MPLGWALKIFSMLTGANIKKALEFVINHWRECLIGILLGIVIYQNRFETRWLFGAETIPALEADLVIVKNNLATCKDGNKVLSDAIDANNASIAQYKELTKDLQASVDVLEGELEAARAESEAEVDAILNEPTPESCEKAIDYLRDAGKELTW